MQDETRSVGNSSDLRPTEVDVKTNTESKPYEGGLVVIERNVRIVVVILAWAGVHLQWYGSGSAVLSRPRIRTLDLDARKNRVCVRVSETVGIGISHPQEPQGTRSDRICRTVDVAARNRIQRELALCIVLIEVILSRP